MQLLLLLVVSFQDKVKKRVVFFVWFFFCIFRDKTAIAWEANLVFYVQVFGLMWRSVFICYKKQQFKKFLSIFVVHTKIIFAYNFVAPLYSSEPHVNKLHHISIINKNNIKKVTNSKYLMQRYLNLIQDG